MDEKTFLINLSYSSFIIANGRGLKNSEKSLIPAAPPVRMRKTFSGAEWILMQGMKTEWKDGQDLRGGMWYLWPEISLGN